MAWAWHPPFLAAIESVVSQARMVIECRRTGEHLLKLISVKTKRMLKIIANKSKETRFTATVVFISPCCCPHKHFLHQSLVYQSLDKSKSLDYLTNLKHHAPPFSLMKSVTSQMFVKYLLVHVCKCSKSESVEV
jgi:hypothetical protein